MLQLRDEGTKLRKWILVNIQNDSEFDCFAVNRDIWNNSDVRELVKKHCLLFQATVASQLGKQYMQYYPVKNYPYIAFIDPCTGELIETFTEKNPKRFINFINDNLRSRGARPGEEEEGDTTNSNEDTNNKPSTNSDSISPKPKSILEFDEEEQVRIAIAKSLRGNDCSDSDDDFGDDIFESADSPSCSSTDPSPVKPLPSPDTNNTSSTISKKRQQSSPSTDTPALKSIKSSNTKEESKSNWKEMCESYKGSSECTIRFRLPDQRMETVSIPSAAPFKVISLCIEFYNETSIINSYTISF